MSRAVYIDVDPASTEHIRRDWEKWGRGVELVVLASPYRSLMEPLLEYIEQLDAQRPSDYVTIVLPEFVPARWWQSLVSQPAGTAHQRRAAVQAESSVSARWYLWDGGFLAIGKSNGRVPPHSHHAIQIVIAINGEMAIKGTRGEWRAGRGVIVRQDAEHSYDGKGASGAMLFVDPESNEGVWLRTVAHRRHHGGSRGATQRLRVGAAHVH